MSARRGPPAGAPARTLACALALLPLVGCASFGHKHPKPVCREPQVTGDVRNFPPLRVPPGLDAPDTRNAVKVPPLPPTAHARLPSDPCLTDPPSFGNLALGTPADAVKSRAPGTYGWLVNAGFALTTGSSSDYLNSGWTVGTGFAWHPKPASRWSYQFELGYANFNASSKFVNLGQQKLQYSISGGSGNVWALTTDAKYAVPITSGSNFYTLLGVGGYHESVQLTENGIYGGYVCDPWGFCYPYATPGDVVVASKSRTMFGWNAGVGVEFPVRESSAWFIEARYNHIAGHRSITYIPIQFGYRF
jgi:opacity protein-like surface antigen